MAFLISTFQLFYFPRCQGVPNLHQGALSPLGAPQRKFFFTQSEYFTISNCVFNFNILALVVSEILGGPKCTLGALCAPYAPQRKIFCTLGDYFTMSDGFFYFNFLALLLSEILGWSQIYTRGPYAPWTRPAEKFLYAKRVLRNV